MSNGGRRRSIVAADSSRLPSIGGSTTTALRSPFGPRRSADDFRPLQAHFRKRSSAEQSLTSFRIGSNDDDLVEEEEEEVDFEEQRLDEDEESKTNSGDRDMTADPPQTDPDEAEDGASSATAASEILPAITATVAVSESETERKRGVSLKRNHTDDSEVERRVAKLLYEINFSGTDSVDESKIQSRCSVGETTTTTSTSTSTTNGVLKSEVETQTMTDQELAALHLQSSQGTVTSCSSSSVGVNVRSSSNNDVISGESSTTDMATGATGGNEGGFSTPGVSGRRFRLLPSLHNVLFPGCGRQRRPSASRQSTLSATSPTPRPPSAPGAVPPFD